MKSSESNAASVKMGCLPRRPPRHKVYHLDMTSPCAQPFPYDAVHLPKRAIRTACRAAAVLVAAASCTREPLPETGHAVSTGVEVRDVTFGPRTCLLSSRGTVLCGVLGERFDEVALPARAKQLAAGSGGTCALLETRETVCWDCSSRPLPRPTLLDHLEWNSRPSPPPPSRTPPAVVSVPRMKQIAVGQKVACGIQEDDGVFCWGEWSQGELSGAFICRTAFRSEGTGVRGCHDKLSSCP